MVRKDYFIFHKLILLSTTILGVAVTMVHNHDDKPKETVDQNIEKPIHVSTKTATDNLNHVAQMENLSASVEKPQEPKAPTETKTEVTPVAEPQATVDTTAVDADLAWIIQHESSGNTSARNGEMFGLGQLSNDTRAKYNAGDSTDYNVQLSAMKAYIADRYGSSANAKSHWLANGWY